MNRAFLRYALVAACATWLLAGCSPGTPGDYTMSVLADDAARLIRELQLGPVVVLGLSLGGMVAQALAIDHPDMVRALVVANSSATYDETIRAVLDQRMNTARDKGMEAIADAVLGRFFRPDFHESAPAVVARFRRRLLSTPVQGYVGCGRAVQHLHLIDQLPAIRQPTLVIGARQDRSTPLEQSEQIHQAIAGSRLEVIEHAAHVSVVEQPQAFLALVQGFLRGL